MKKLLFTILIVFVVSCASHDKQNQHYATKIAVDALQKDIIYAHKQLVNMHPDLYWYISKEALDNKFDSITRSLKHPLTPNEFYLKLSPVIAAIRQGHLSMSMIYLTSPDSLKKKYKGSVHPLSHFDYEYLDNRLFIKKNRSKKDSLLQRGTEVLSINGIKPADLFTKYRPTYSSDGFNSTAIPKIFARKVNSFFIAEIGFVDRVTIEALYADSLFNYTVERIFKKDKKLLKQHTDSLLKNKNDTITRTENRLATNFTLKRKDKKSKKKQSLKNKNCLGLIKETKHFQKNFYIHYKVIQR